MDLLAVVSQQHVAQNVILVFVCLFALVLRGLGLQTGYASIFQVGPFEPTMNSKDKVAGAVRKGMGVRIVSKN